MYTGKTLLLFYLTIVLIILLPSFAAKEEEEEGNLNLLALVPWPDERPHADWDAGPDLLAGARVAIKEINNSTDILPDYKLNLIESGHEACGLPGGNFGVVNLVKYAINPSSNSRRGPVAAVLGLFCSTSTKIIAPFAGRNGIDLLQLSGSNSPDFLRDKELYPHLWRFLESATVHADTVISMMDAFDWKKVALVADFENSFHSGIGDAFINKVNSRDDLNLLYRGNLLQLRNIDKTVRGILESRARIIFLSTTAPQTAKIYCVAASLNMNWPNYVWIMADYLIKVIEDEVATGGYCSLTELRKVTEGSLITYFSLEPDNPSSTILVSNNTYQDYKDAYNKELELVKSDYPQVDIPGEYLYAGIIYDQVWAFAIAAHNSLPELERKNYSISEYGFGQPHITTIIEKYLKNVDFIGATGRVSFNNNSEVSNSIKIFRSTVQIGSYDARNSNPLNISIDDPPDDDVSVVINVLPSSLAIVILTLSVLVAIIVTVDLVIMMYLRNHNEIRALSPNLSLLIFIGCYFECVASVLLVIESWVHEIPDDLFTINCNLVTWIGHLGIYLILATNLLKIARVSRVFSHFGKTGRCWKNYVLSVWILLMCSFPCSLIPLWVILDPLKLRVTMNYRTDAIPIFLELVPHCHCNYYIMWKTILHAYVAILIFGLIFFAVQTRKINRRDFKDTKKVNGFVFVTMFLVIIFLASHQVLRDLEQYKYADVSLCLLYLSMSLVCQIFLFMPKVIPSSYDRFKNGETAANRRQSVASIYDDPPPSPHTFTKTIIRSRLFSQASIAPMN